MIVGQHHLHNTLVIIEPDPLGDQGLVDAGERDVKLHQLLALLQQGKETLVEVDQDVPGLGLLQDGKSHLLLNLLDFRVPENCQSEARSNSI